MATFYFGQGDDSPALTDTLYDSTGAIVALTGATVTFTMTDRLGNVVINAGSTTNGGANGQVTYTWGATDLANSGTYYGKWKVTFAGGLIESFPNADGSSRMLIVVTPK